MKYSNQTFGFSLLFVLGLILAFSPVDRMAQMKVSRQQLVKELQKQHFYMAPEDLAHMIIDKEPGFVVIDVRNKDDYQKYHIPGSINIPFDQILTSNTLKDLAQDNMLILASNGNTMASEAWLLLKENGFKDVYILSGGMNYWVAVFTNPKPPTGIYTDDEVFRYQFRHAAGPVMMGTKLAANQQAERQKTVHKPIIRVKHKKKATFDEGC